MVLDLEQVLASFFPEMMLENITDDTLKNGEAVDRKRLNVLFAEDSFTIRKEVIKVLNRAGFDRITAFENGQDALHYCMGHIKDICSNQCINVLISDIEMPQMDGLTLCFKLKQHPELKKIHVIMFSSLINNQMIEKCRKVEADGYITKPESNALIKILDQLCQS